MTEHWMDKRMRENKPIALEGNYIRIPAKAWVAFQDMKNRQSGRHQSLYEANKAYEGGK